MVSKVEGAGSLIVGLISLLGEWLCAVYVNMCVEGSKREAGAHKLEGVCVLSERSQINGRAVYLTSDYSDFSDSS